VSLINITANKKCPSKTETVLTDPGFSVLRFYQQNRNTFNYKCDFV